MSESKSAPTSDSEVTQPAKKSVKNTAKKAAKKTAKKVATPKTPTPTPKKEIKLDAKAEAKAAMMAEIKAEIKAELKAEARAAMIEAEKNTQQNNKPQQNPNQNKQQQQGQQGQQQQQGQPQKKQTVKRGKTRNAKSNQNPNQNPNQRQNPNQQNKQGKQNNRRNRNPRQQNTHQHNRQERKVELTGDPVQVNGMLELAPKGFGFLRTLDKGLVQATDDIFVTPELIRTFGLRLGVWIHGEAKQGPKGLQLFKINEINGKPPEDARKLPHFEELKAVNPNKKISFETTPEKFTTRVLDIISPVGRGQRGLIVSPPRSGKTTIMMDMAEAIQDKYEETMHLIILLVDERPEEVTEFRHKLPDAEIFASSNDSGAKNHCRVAELCIERAKRLVEAGEHVFILMDSITRLARAYNGAMGGDKKGKGRGIQSGGIISGALEMPRRIFAAARNTRSAGSLTIVATALVHTNSRADDAIFQEFKGTGNMELVLDRRIAEKYIYPAVDIFKSGTRREELLLPEISLHKIHLIRRGLAGHRPEEAMERLTFFLKKFSNNAQMLLEIKG